MAELRHRLAAIICGWCVRVAFRCAKSLQFHLRFKNRKPLLQQSLRGHKHWVPTGETSRERLYTLPPLRPPFLPKRHFPGEGGGGVYLEAPCGRNFFSPLFIRPPPLDGYFQGWGLGVYKIRPRKTLGKSSGTAEEPCRARQNGPPRRPLKRISGSLAPECRKLQLLSSARSFTVLLFFNSLQTREEHCKDKRI